MHEIAFIFSHVWQLTSQKNISSAQKPKNKLTIDLLSLCIYASGPNALTYRPRILREVQNNMKSFPGSEGHSPTPHTSRYPRVLLSGFTEPKRFPAGTAAPARAKILFGSENPPKKPVGTNKCVEWCFGCEESEYEVSFDLAHWNGELSPSDPQTPEPLSLRSGPGAQNGLHIRSSRKIWGLKVKAWAPGAHITRDKRSMVKCFFFLKIANGESIVFLLVNEISRPQSHVTTSSRHEGTKKGDGSYTQYRIDAVH